MSRIVDVFLVEGAESLILLNKTFSGKSVHKSVKAYKEPCNTSLVHANQYVATGVVINGYTGRQETKYCHPAVHVPRVNEE